MAIHMEDYGASEEFNTKKLKGTFFEFHLNYLLEQPRNIYAFGLKYFHYKNKSKKTILIHDFSQREVPVHNLYDNYPPRERIKMIINNSMLRSLSDEDKLCLIRTAKRREVSVGEEIISQWEKNSYFYLIEKGLFNVYISHDKNQKAKLIYIYKNAGAFGDLSMIYDKKPRNVTVVASSYGAVWYWDCTVFNCYIFKPLVSHRNLIGRVFSRHEAFASLHPYEIIQLTDAATLKKFNCGDLIYVQGYLPGSIFFVISGSVVSAYIDNFLELCAVVEKYLPNSCFGSSELLCNTMRKTSAIARTDCLVALISGDYFQELPHQVKKYFRSLLNDYSRRVAKVIRNIADMREESKISRFYDRQTRRSTF